MISTFSKNFLMRAAAKAFCFVLFMAFCFSTAVTAGAAQASSGSAPVRVGGDIKPPIKTKDAKPVYPPMARQMRTQGTVILEVTIGDDGKVKAVKVLKSLALLDAAATDAVKQWEFKPTMLNGKAISVIMTTAVNFSLD
jgi:TonB family protein